ncbi:MAG: STM4015 family protein [Candidatus Eremiobacterota bacterium]
MPIEDHYDTFLDMPVRDWEPGGAVVDPAAQAVRISLDWDQGQAGALWSDKLAKYLAMPFAARTVALIVGTWGEPAEGGADEVVTALVSARNRLPDLRALFIGEITVEEAEISWIQQANLSCLLAAYPALEHFQARGGQGLELGAIRSSTLRQLVLETGGMPRQVLLDLARSELPGLEYLELWLGEENYGWDGSVEDVRPLLRPGLFPRLEYLGLLNSEIADEIAELVTASPLPQTVKVLDLSMGTLSDRGAKALLNWPEVRRLERLVLDHHFCSPEMTARLRALPCTVEIDESLLDPREDYRYCAVGE